MGNVKAASAITETAREDDDHDKNGGKEGTYLDAGKHSVFAFAVHLELF